MVMMMMVVMMVAVMEMMAIKMVKMMKTMKIEEEGSLEPFLSHVTIGIFASQLPVAPDFGSPWRKCSADEAKGTPCAAPAREGSAEVCRRLSNPAVPLSHRLPQEKIEAVIRK